MIWSAYLGLPFSLKGVGAVLKLENQKLDEGKELIKYFSVPCLPTKANGGRTRNLPHHDFAKWSKFKFYNKRDVEVEMDIQKRLLRFPVPDFVWDEYHIDQEINDRGVYIDSLLVEAAIKTSDKTSLEISKSLQNLTNLENPNSVQQFRSWLSNNGVVTDELGKKTVKTLLKNRLCRQNRRQNSFHQSRRRPCRQSRNHPRIHHIHDRRRHRSCHLYHRTHHRCHHCGKYWIRK